jgi:hypothetical protein
MKIAIPLCFAFVLWSGLAFAGTLNRSHDADSMLNLSSGDVAQLQQDVGKVPFDVRLLVESAPSVSALGNDAHQAIEGFPNSMVIAIDPAGHIAVRFGKGVGVKPGDFDSISKSGNAHFHNHEWVAGIETIVLRAQASAQSTTAISQSSTPIYVKQEQGLSTGTWVLIVVLVCGFAGLAIWLYRRNRKDREEYKRVLDETREEAAELRSRNVDEMTLPENDPPAPRRSPTPAPTRSASYSRERAPLPASVPYSPPARTYAPAPVQAPVIINNPVPMYGNSYGGGGSDLLTGMLIGESLERPRVVEREVIVEREARHSYSRDDDAGGGGSTFDGGSSSFSSSTSDDAGGSSSTFDSSGSDSSFSSDSSSSSDSSFSDSGSSDGGGGGGDF